MPDSNAVITIHGREVPYRLTRTRRRTLGLSVTESGVRVNVPKWVSKAEIDLFLHERIDWLLKNLEKIEQTRREQPELRDGENVFFLGIPLKIRAAPCLFPDIRRNGRMLWASVSHENEVPDLVRSWLKTRAAPMLRRRVMRYASIQGGRVPEFALSDAKSQWGICHPDGRIRLNWRLVQAPLSIIDYVAAHEVAHLLHADHSRRFWNQVETLFPEADNARAWLNRHGHKLMI
jgi:predicted metal-dependent hydrolase